ncbi:MAG: copper resistance CopC/CopD family protein [Gaiellaceae bacterium]|jgi:copper transport protein
MTTRRIAGLLAAAAFLVFPGRALAHATLVRSVPENGAVLARGPRQARFVFDDPVRIASGIRAVRNGAESVLGGRPRVVGGKTLVVPLAPLDDGDYTVLWRVVADDGHTESGVISFAVGAGRSPPTPSLSAQNGPTGRDVVSRWLFFAGLLVAAGGALFRLAAGVGRPLLSFPAFVAVFLGASALLPHEGTLSSRFGIAYAVAALIAGLGASAAAISLAVPRIAPVVWLCGLALLPIPSVAGHALDAGRPRIEVGVDLLHLAAAAVWTGGLVQLAFALRAGVALGDVLRRFSAVALTAVAVLSITGVIRALAELRSVSQLWTTGYGRLLIIKTALLALLAGVGWLNRYRLVPRGDARALRRNVSGELVLLGMLVVAVAILTAARPGRDYAHAAAATRTASAPAPPPLPPRNAFVTAQEAGDFAVGLAAEPHRVRVSVLGPDGIGASGLRVTIFGAPTAACGAGCYETDASPQAVIPVDVSGMRLRFRVTPRAPRADALVARATRTFRALRSVRYVERLASSPTNRIVSTFTLETPDRLAYRIHGGASAVVIGARRWDGCTPSTTTRLPQPEPAWEGPTRNAHLVARTADVDIVSWLNPKIPAWFTVRFDRRTLRPRSLTMTAAAHFMHHVYMGFDAPRRIFPPRC